MMAFKPIFFVIEKGMLAMSRSNEFQADRYAHQFGKSQELVSGLVVMFKENKGVINPDPMYFSLFVLHPRENEEEQLLNDEHDPPDSRGENQAAGRP